MAGFLILTLSIVIGAHWYLWWALIKIFGITDFRAKLLIALGLVLLFGSMILVFVLSRFAESQAVRSFYFVVMILQGIFWQMVFWLLVAMPIWAISQAIGSNAKFSYFGLGAVVIVLVSSVYGIWSAHSGLMVRHVDLGFNNLPAGLDGKKIVQISDTHIGLTNRAEFASKVTEMVNAEQADYIVISLVITYWC